jgi:glycosyltransferase 2 family protein
MTVGKIAITVAAIVIIGSHINFGFFESHRHKLSAVTVVVVLILLASQVSIIAGLRLKLILDAVGQRCGVPTTVQVALSGFFFEQVAFGFVGGDAMRLWLLHRTDVPLRSAVEAIVIDRCFGLAGLLLLAGVGLPGLVALLTGFHWLSVVAAGLVAAAIGGVLAVLLLMRMARWLPPTVVAEIKSLIHAARDIPGVRNNLLTAFVLAAATHCMNVVVFLLLGRDLGISLTLWQWFLIVPPALLISMLPISAGGWGLREASFVVGLASFGIRPEEAILPPIIFGLGVLAVTLPGGVIWLVNRKRAASEGAAGGSSEAQADGRVAETPGGPDSAEVERTRHRRELMRLS